MRDDLATTYDALLSAPELESDPNARPNLENYRPRHELLLRALDQHLEQPRETIADVGCHNGFFLRMSSVLGFRQFLAIDAFPLQPERSFLTSLEGVRFIQANFNTPRFLNELPDGAVDCVISTEVFEHLFNHPLGYLIETWRILRPGGIMLFSTPNPSTAVKAAKILFGRSPTWGDITFAEVEKVTGDKPAAFWDIHFREYTARDLQSLLERLPGSAVIESGFIANAASSSDTSGKRWAKATVHKCGLAQTRIVSATQWYVVKKTSS